VTSLPDESAYTLEHVIDDSKQLLSKTRSNMKKIKAEGDVALRNLQLRREELLEMQKNKTRKLFKNREQIPFLSNLVLSELKNDPLASVSEARRAIWFFL